MTSVLVLNSFLMTIGTKSWDLGGCEKIVSMTRLDAGVITKIVSSPADNRTHLSVYFWLVNL